MIYDYQALTVKSRNLIAGELRHWGCLGWHVIHTDHPTDDGPWLFILERSHPDGSAL